MGISARLIEHAIYDWVYDNFGKQEASNPSWYTPNLAKYVAKALNDLKYRAKHKIKYDHL